MFWPTIDVDGNPEILGTVLAQDVSIVICKDAVVAEKLGRVSLMNTPQDLQS